MEHPRDPRRAQPGPRQGRPEQGRPEQGRPEQGRPEQGRPEQGEERLPGAGEERREPAKDIVRRKSGPG